MVVVAVVVEVKIRDGSANEEPQAINPSHLSFLSHTFPHHNDASEDITRVFSLLYFQCPLH